MSVLVIDDNRNFARFLRSALATRGYACRAVATSEAALKAVREERFDLFIVDLRLPDGDGRKLISTLIENHGVAPEQVIITTALTRDQLGGTRALSAHPVLFKPFRLTWLLDQLRALSPAG